MSGGGGFGKIWGIFRKELGVHNFWGGGVCKNWGVFWYHLGTICIVVALWLCKVTKWMCMGMLTAKSKPTAVYASEFCMY